MRFILNTKILQNLGWNKSLETDLQATSLVHGTERFFFKLLIVLMFTGYFSYNLLIAAAQYKAYN